ncbi:glycerol-3-phosphate 1-O-acyltransferase PlsB [Ferrimonas balearica]|uniref:glycerol-3-phosphate 1-O-acyltransferase PlsB n=1 Tax=Ferrimonas balearica TaxID=44012 RepID=UPI001C99BCD4|nr:glycerol-3-phosphate 1-O-acyltransferase PlsB [Ferrimonas balearica]MBY5994045.1 glycerol-3-phosphate 1-O-acyltransferase PlsB [Ferrimonas balearica]
MNHNTIAAWQQPLRWAQKALVTSKAVPEDPIAELDLDPQRPLVYVLPHESFSDRLALHECCQKLGLPSPFEPLVIKGENVSRIIALEPAQLLFGQGRTTDFKARFERLLAMHREHEDLDVQVVPVSLLWGRNPGKGEESVSATLLNKKNPTWLRKTVILAMLGRDNFIRFSRAVSLRHMADQHGTDGTIANKLARVARVHFGRQRTVATGPRLPDRQALFHSLLASPAIKEAIADEAKSKKISEQKARARAREYLEEIAADYSDSLTRIGDRILSWLWNKLYSGLNVRGAEQVRQLSQDGHEIVFVPCHRSHMDYLLLSYVIYRQGMVPPHIAAGVNLNFWPAGPIFRRGGAFFIRRSFKGNKLYSAVFREYLDQLFKRGYSVEYFCEGGRSRTGRLLPPKTGMIAMTVNSVLRGLERPVTLVPVYLGYDHVMEVSTYHKELAGKKKEKESAWQVFSAIRKLRDYGQGYVNFGAPITLHHFLNEHAPSWREDTADGDLKHTWMTPTVNKLANQVMTHINDAAAASAMTLTASILLATEQHAMPRKALEKQLDLYLDLLRAVPYTPLATAPEGDGEAVLKQVLDLNKFHVSQDAMGEIISVHEGNAVSLTYYRNNTLHLLVLPALMASLLLRKGCIERDTLLAETKALYPLLEAELFMGLEGEELDSYLNALLNEFIRLEILEDCQEGLVPRQSRRAELHNLANQVQETLQRYAIVLSRLQQEPEIERGTLEKESQALAERLSKLHGISAPEFFDKKVFTTLTTRLKDQGYLGEDADRAKVAALAETTLALIPATIQNSILHRD